MISMTRRYGLWTLVIGGVSLILLLTGVSFGLQSSFKPKSCPAGPTAAKTQSKLWFNDGTWWGILFDGSTEEYRIYRYDRTRDASLPSPTSPVVFEVGPFTLRYFGLLNVLGIVVGTCLTGRELDRKGYDGALAIESLFFVVPLGVVGARLYHVATEYDSQYAASSYSSVLEIWNGGLGVYGAVAGGFLGVLLFSWYRGISPLTFADAAAPASSLPRLSADGATTSTRSSSDAPPTCRGPYR
jgi:hypothetical protein